MRYDGECAYGARGTDRARHTDRYARIRIYQIELVEPVNAEVSFEEAAIRDMYDATVYAATVLPVVREYAPEYAFEFGAFGAFEGEAVKKGQQLVSANTESIDEQIKAYEAQKKEAKRVAKANKKANKARKRKKNK